MEINKFKIPVIIDTDIGGDIDDTWALVFALLRDEFDIKLITTVLGDPTYRAKVIAKLNESCGKGTIDLGFGKSSSAKPGCQYEWVENYNLSDYKGKIYEDGIDRMIEIVKESTETVTIIALGPCSNLAEAAKRYPEIGSKVRVVGVFGAIHVGYCGDVCPEYNVMADVDAARTFLKVYKNALITPIDTCFDAIIDKPRYSRLENCRKDSRAVDTLLENFEIWGRKHPRWANESFDHTSELCDAVAVYLAITNSGLVNETLKLEVEDDGTTVESDSGEQIEAAMKWSDIDIFLDFLTDTYCNAKI